MAVTEPNCIKLINLNQGMAANEPNCTKLINRN